MKLNLKQLLTLTVFLVSASCSATAIGKEGLINKIEASKDKMVNFYDNKTCKSMIKALDNPRCFIDAEYKLNIDKKCKDKHAHDFYRIIFKDDKADENLKKFSEHCKTHDSLEGLDESIAKVVRDSYEEKKKFLTEIVYQIPVVDEYRNASGDFDDIIKSHIDKFIDDSLVYDGKRLTFSNLHKAVESIKNVHKVERKASDGVDAALEMLKNKDTKWTTFKPSNAFRIKKASVEVKKEAEKKDEKKDEKKTENKPQNIVEVAIKASDKSTSSPVILGFVLGGSLLISMILLVFKAYTAEEVKNDEEEEQH